MTYAMSAALQEAVFQKLLSHSGVAALVGSAIYDAVPTGTVPETYVSLGPEDVRDRSDATGHGADHRFVVSVVSAQSGFDRAKRIAAEIGDALVDGDLALSRGRTVGVWFERATARRTGRAGRTRRIDLRFRARAEDN